MWRSSIVHEPDMTPWETLAALAAQTDPSQLLPELRRVEGSPVPKDLSLVGATRLSPQHWIGVFSDETGQLLAAPFRRAGTALARSVPGDGAAAALASLMTDASELDDGGFSVTAFDHADVDGLGVDGLGVDGLGADASERALDVDQTHESVVVGGAAVVKWAVHAEPTPAPVLIAQLNAACFTEMPQPWGFVTWTDGQREVLVASVMQYLPGASDGWTWGVLDAGGYVARGGDLQTSVEALGVVGAVIADMHAALATPSDVMPAPVQMAGGAQVHQWRGLAYALLDEALTSVDGDEGRRLKHLKGPIGETFDVLGEVADTPSIPVHGDLHIGQVLRWAGGYAVGDFDGNPVLPVGERLVPQPAARDVAGLLQSIDHVGRVVLRRVEGADAAQANVWIAEAQARFLSGYTTRLGELGFPRLLDDRLLRPFQVEQECREFLYAVRHLPRWRYVPDQALQALFPPA